MIAWGAEGFVWMEGTTHTDRAFVSPEAIIGRAPEMDDWDPDAPTFPPVVHMGARIEPLVTIDAGRWQPTYIGEVYILKHAHVGHDARVEDGSVLATGCIIGGHAIIRRDVKIGLGAVVLPFVRVGARARVGAGAVVVDHVADGQTVVGNPARPLFIGRRRTSLKCCGGQLPDEHLPDCEFTQWRSSTESTSQTSSLHSV